MPEIVVLAGVNGAGKSSIAGASLRSSGGEYYNADDAAARYIAAGLPRSEAGSRAWHRGRALLERAIDERLDYAFETTLGGRTMTALLLKAASQGARVRLWFVGLASPELHVRRVAERVARGGHPIPTEKIRARWRSSRENLIRLIPHVAHLAVRDNSAEADVDAGDEPEPVRVLEMLNGRITYVCALDAVPVWAKPIVAAAVEHAELTG